MVTFPNQRGVQMAPLKADYSGFSESFKDCFSPVLCSQKSRYPMGRQSHSQAHILACKHGARGVVEHVPALELPIG